jgi:hypothetical protein
MVRQAGFFDLEERLTFLAAKGDGLERLSAVVDFELFRPELERAVPRADRSKGGRPPFDHVLMFKGAGPADPEQSESLPETLMAGACARGACRS